MHSQEAELSYRVRYWHNFSSVDCDDGIAQRSALDQYALASCTLFELHFEVAALLRTLFCDEQNAKQSHTREQDYVLRGFCMGLGSSYSILGSSIT